MTSQQRLPKQDYDYLLKFLLVGDSDVGKDEIMMNLNDEVVEHVPIALQNDISHKTTTILLDGKRVKLQLWDASGQGRFNTIIRSYSRGAQAGRLPSVVCHAFVRQDFNLNKCSCDAPGRSVVRRQHVPKRILYLFPRKNPSTVSGILLVYDITNRWSFDGIDRWLKEIDGQAPGVPRILLGNRLHLEFKRAVSRSQALTYAEKTQMEYFEVSPLADFNIMESLSELTRLVLNRNRMHWMLKPKGALSLQEICCRCIVTHIRTIYAVKSLPLPEQVRLQLRSYAIGPLLQQTTSNNIIRHQRTSSGTSTLDKLWHSAGRNSIREKVPKLRSPRRHKTLTLPASTSPQTSANTANRKSCHMM